MHPKMKMELQTGKTLIRLLLKEELFDLSLHFAKTCLPKNLGLIIQCLSFARTHIVNYIKLNSHPQVESSDLGLLFAYRDHLWEARHECV